MFIFMYVIHNNMILPHNDYNVIEEYEVLN
jgi:hypothetical protein